MSSNLSFSLLSSGSRANCIYLSDGTTKVLLDCGLSCKQTVQRLASIGVDAGDIDAIVVTHEHSDHVSGVGIFHRKFGTPVYSNRDTRNCSAIMQQVDDESWVELTNNEAFKLGAMNFMPFSVEHDASDPVAFRVSASGRDLGILTDLGQRTSYVCQQIKGVDALVLEANHDLEMLYDAPYPWSVKERIKSRKGHLKNEQAAEILVDKEIGLLESLQVVVAAHISEKSNTPERATKVLRDAWIAAGGRENQRFVAAGIKEATELITII
jgi:phosphoribosyl 1,2-cyclic phosphodiesterase